MTIKKGVEIMAIRQHGDTIGEITVRVNAVEYHYWRLTYYEGGRRIRKTHTTKEGAEKALASMMARRALNTERDAIMLARIGRKARKLSDDDLLDAVKGLDILKRCAPLAKAAEFYMVHHKPDGGGGERTVSELLPDYVLSKKNAGRRPETLAGIRYRIGKLAEDFGKSPVHAIGAQALEEWLNRRGYRGVTRLNFKVAFTGFWNYAIKRGFALVNPARDIEKPTLDEKMPDILTVAEVGKLMRAAEATAPEMIPYLALCTFAGLRPAEAQACEWRHVNLEAKRIRVTAITAKKRRTRLVDITDNLLLWLLPHRKTEGTVFYSRRAMHAVRKAAGIRWAHDVLRHCYGSYHLARWEDQNKTSLQMGHKDTDVLFNHYRDLVTREDAEAFWQLRPATESNVVELNAQVS